MRSASESSRWITAIGVFKIVKAAALVALGAGIFHLWKRGPEQVLGPWLESVHFDAKGEHVHRLAARVLALDAKRLAEIGIGSFLYGAVFAVEGVGLLLKRTWAEYLTLVVTVSFLPLEVIEIVHRSSAPKWMTLVLNVAVAIYLAARIALRAKERRTGGARSSNAAMAGRPASV